MIGSGFEIVGAITDVEVIAAGPFGVKVTHGAVFVGFGAAPEGVPIPFVAQAIDTDTQTFKATESNERAATTMLDELARWEGALKALRA